MPSSRETRRFYLDRQEDVTGVSGTGKIAHGVQFTDGSVVLRWIQEPAYTFFPNIERMIKIHGHDGKTKIVWID